MSDLLYKAGLDVKEFLAGLKKIDGGLAGLDKKFGQPRGVKALGEAVTEAGKKAKAAEGQFGSFFSLIKVQAGIAAAAVLGIGAGVVTAFTLAKGAIEGVRLQSSFEALAASAGTTGEAILSAMQKASAGTISNMELMRQANLAMQLGVAKSPAEFEKLTKSAVILGRSVGRGPTEALYDLINAAGRRSTEVLDTLGISLAEVNARMEALAQQEFGQSAQSLDVAARNALFMRAAIEQANEQAERLGTTLEDVGSGLERAQARAENFKQDLSEGFLIVSDRGLIAAEGVFNAFFGPKGVFPLLAEGGNAVQEVFARITAAFFATAAAIARRGQIVINAFKGQASFEDFFNPAEIVSQFGQDFDAALGKIKVDFEQIFDPAAAAEGITPVFENGIEAAETGGDDLAKAMEDAAEKTKDAMKDFDEGVEDAHIDFQRDLEKIDLEAERRRTDILLDGAREREKAARKHLEELADIRRKNGQEIEDADRDLSREESQIARDFASERIEIEFDQRSRRLDIEKNFRRSLRDITRQADAELSEAERSRDAVAFLRIQREKQQQIGEAQTERRRGIADLRTETQERKAELERRRQLELEQARITHAERLEDLRINLEREIEEQNIAHARQLETINIGEQQKLADLETWRTRQREDARTNLEHQLQDLQLNLNRQLETIKEFVSAAEAEYASLASAAAAANGVAAQRTTTGTIFPGVQPSQVRPQPRRTTALGTPFAGFAEGGFISAHQPAIVGERGPELFMPSLPGTIIPNERLLAGLSGIGGGNITYNQQRQATANLSMLDPGQLSATQRAMTENLILQMLNKIL